MDAVSTGDHLHDRGRSDADHEAVNVGGTQNAIEAAAAAGATRLVHCSTAGVRRHGPGTCDRGESRREGGGPYHRTKLAAELVARDAA
jgi:nucleoside-diphosphate-sugar epimerase